MSLKTVMEKTCGWCVAATLVAISVFVVLWMVSFAQLVN